MRAGLGLHSQDVRCEGQRLGGGGGEATREGGWGYLEGIGLIAGDVAHNSDHAKLTGANNAMHLQIMVLYLGLGNLALLGAVTPCHTLLQKGLQGCSQNCLCHLPG